MVQELRDTATPAEEAHFLTPSLEDDADDVLDTSEVPDQPLLGATSPTNVSASSTQTQDGSPADAAQGSQEQQAQAQPAPPAEGTASPPAPANAVPSAATSAEDAPPEGYKAMFKFNPNNPTKAAQDVRNHFVKNHQPKQRVLYEGAFGKVALTFGRENKVPVVKPTQRGTPPTYKSIIDDLALPSVTEDDKAEHITMAKTLLSTEPDLSGYSASQRDAMAMLDAIANISEPTRKKGADILYRAFLRLVSDPKSGVLLTTRDLEEHFSFAVKAELGRKQVLEFIKLVLDEAMIGDRKLVRPKKLGGSTANSKLAGYVSENPISNYFSDPEEIGLLVLPQSPRYVFLKETLDLLRSRGIIDDAHYKALMKEGQGRTPRVRKRKLRKKKESNVHSMQTRGKTRLVKRPTTALHEGEPQAKLAHTPTSALTPGQNTSEPPVSAALGNDDTSEAFGQASQTASASHQAQVQQEQAQLERIMGMPSSSSKSGDNSK